MSATEIIADYPDSIYPLLNKTFHGEYKDPTGDIAAVANVEMADRVDFENMDFVGHTYLKKKVHEEDDAEFVKGGQGYPSRYIIDEFDQGVKVTYKHRKWSLYKEPLDKVKKLGRAARITPVRDFYGIFRNAFSTSFLGPDGEPLIDADHPSIKGFGDRSNRVASNPVLGPAGFNTARRMLQEQKDHQDILIGSSGSKLKLVIPPALHEDAFQLRDSQFVPEANNFASINVYKGEFDIIETPWIGAAAGGSDTAWFLIDPGICTINFYWGDKPFLRQGNRTENNVDIHVVYASWAHGWDNFLGIVGSSGAGS